MMIKGCCIQNIHDKLHGKRSVQIRWVTGEVSSGMMYGNVSHSTQVGRGGSNVKHHQIAVSADFELAQQNVVAETDQGVDSSE